MSEKPRRGRQARYFTTNVSKIVDLESSSEQILSESWRWVPLKRTGQICSLCLVVLFSFGFIYLLIGKIDHCRHWLNFDWVQSCKVRLSRIFYPFRAKFFKMTVTRVEILWGVNVSLNSQSVMLPFSPLLVRARRKKEKQQQEIRGSKDGEGDPRNNLREI